MRDAERNGVAHGLFERCGRRQSEFAQSRDVDYRWFEDDIRLRRRRFDRTPPAGALLGLLLYTIPQPTGGAGYAGAKVDRAWGNRLSVCCRRGRSTRVADVDEVAMLEAARA